MMRIDNLSLGTPGAGADAATDLAGGALSSGNLRGEEVLPTTAQSVLTDAAEEITFANSEKAEEKDIEERKIETPTEIQLMQIDEIEELLDRMNCGEVDGAKMRELAKFLLANGGAQARQGAKEAFSEPARQFLALQYALGHAQSEGADQATLDEISDAIAELSLESGREIRAALNTAGAIGAATTTGEDAWALQETYRDLTIGEASLGDTLKALLEQFGDDFAGGLHGLLRALGDDIAATRPSTDKVRLQTLVSDLYQLEVTHTLLEQCAGVATVLGREHDVPPFAAHDLLKEVVRLTGERWLGGGQITRLAEQFGCAEAAPQIRFLTELKSVLRDLPVKVFSDPEARQGLAVALQDALDAAIDREEEGL